MYQLTEKGLALELTAKGRKYFKDDDLNLRLAIHATVRSLLRRFQFGSPAPHATINLMLVL